MLHCTTHIKAIISEILPLSSATRRMVKKKTALETVNTQIKLIKKSGKHVNGIRGITYGIHESKVKLVVLASNCPEVDRMALEYLAFLSNVKVLPYKGNSIELSNAFGNDFPAYAVGVIDLGESSILDKVPVKKEIARSAQAV